MNLILASASARRCELLALTGLPFRVLPAEVDETRLPGESPAGYVLRLSREKARRAAASIPPGPLVLAADTTVADGDEVLGKPATPEQARQMLRRLRGRSHAVLTGLALLDTRGGRLLTDLSHTEVPMRAYSESEIEAYVASGDPFDKAGGYAIQHNGFRPVAGLAGCYANVMGLPLCHLTRLLRSLHSLAAEPPADVPTACQAFTTYRCPVYDRILRREL